MLPSAVALLPPAVGELSAEVLDTYYAINSFLVADIPVSPQISYAPRFLPAQKDPWDE
ncbi:MULTISPECIES: hypothetical protein [unclassified Streptomyces]|uniref:hypothetical protein n=1 Tax=Streptomyces sp. NPDC127129 TaxID=3345373 RepID=UPI003631F7A4